MDQAVSQSEDSVTNFQARVASSVQQSLAAPVAAVGDALASTGGQAERWRKVISRHGEKALERDRTWIRSVLDDAGSLAPRLVTPALPMHALEHAIDLAQREVLFFDTLRQRGNRFIEQEENEGPPPLAFPYDVIVNGRDLPRPCNYTLVRIRPDEDVPCRENGRPYIIIDPRAGHGSGIGGFKDESEVGCALREGHPVYFVIFTKHPVPGQTIADVCAAEAEFVRTVRRNHPEAPQPIIVGNCQGGWGAMLLAATNPDITGPVVANGAPLSYWSGMLGKDTMRYLGGVSGGMLPAMVLSDLAGGEFDGANLVLNFEGLNPANTWWMKYYAVLADENEAPRYLDFERWWSGFFFMNEEEIRWILENLFVGNKLARGQANLDARTHVDLRAIRSPIIIFCSHGDNITPPSQALNWIADNYASVDEIKARGQRIIYTLHPDIGHLGIFVSSKIARKQHQEIVSTLKTIEALAPGLYELVIEDVSGSGVDKTFTVAFQERSVEDVVAIGGGRDSEPPFASVARLALLGAELYDLGLRPMVKTWLAPFTQQFMVDMHPLRMRRVALSDRNPAMLGLPGMADMVRENRMRSAADNPVRELETRMAGSVAYLWNVWRESVDAMLETCFFGLWGSPTAQAVGAPGSRRISEEIQEPLEVLPEVQNVLDRLDRGGFAEAVVRMLIMLAQARGGVRRDRLERSNAMLVAKSPFKEMDAKTRTRMIHEQALVVTFGGDAALSTLRVLMPDAGARREALSRCLEIAGPIPEMDAKTRDMFATLADALESPDPIVEAESRPGPALAGDALEAV